MNRMTLQYLDWLKERLAQISEHMVNGTPQSFEAYQRLVGQYEGLNQALTQLETLLKGDDE